jgi:photosystem II stability/assembly factor-like uncharacterized protein
MNTKFARVLLSVFLAAALGAVPAWASGPFHALRFRNLGPAVAGGRVTSVVGVAGDPALYYVGTAGGGVWKTTDGGMSWRNVFDHGPTISIGAVALVPGHPDWVWVGTGEDNPRNDMLNGDGIYFSPDGGRTWVNKGLDHRGQISDVLINPDDANNVYACVLGDVWKPTPHRGVYETTNGGKTWKKILYLNPHTGCSTLAFEPGNPKVLIAGMWPVQRRPWILVSGGRSGGLYRSLDGGAHWTRLTHGLPKGPIGRSAVAFAPSQPTTVYAVIQARGGTVWVSHDLGSHWHEVSNDHNDDVRPFYFTQLAVFPNNPDRLFFLSMKLMESMNGGRTSFYADPGVHVDHHAIWIDPHDPNRIIQGNDGGVYLSLDGGKHWRFLDNLPIEQFYQVATNDRVFPFLICGGLQDNNAWCGASSDYRRGGVVGFQDWFQVSGGDGQYVVPAPSDPNIIYATTDDGYIVRYNRLTRRVRSINPYLRDVLTGDLLSGKVLAKQKYRFDWTTPIAVSRTNPNDVYVAGDVLFHSMDGGKHWTVVSPDLTRDVKSKQGPTGGPIDKDLSGAETYDTIQSVTIAPTNPRVLWVGTDDGWVWVTRDGGRHWSNVTPSGAPKWARVWHVTVSWRHAGTAYVVFDAHMLGNDRPYVFRTTDYGRSWHKITRGLPDHSVLVVRSDPNAPNLLMAGTMDGLYYSLDDGGRWLPLHANLPSAAIFDLQFVRRTHSLVLATHGRGVWVLDNLRPLEHWSTKVAREPFHLFPAAPGTLVYASHTNSAGPSNFRAPNAPEGVVLTYSLHHALKTTPAEAAAHRTPVTIVVRNSAGGFVDRFYGTAHAGVNQAIWTMQYRGPARLRLAGGQRGGFFSGGFGPVVPPGVYRISVTADGETRTVMARVHRDPNYREPLAVYRANTRLGLEMRSVLSAFNRVLDRVAFWRRDLGAVLARARKHPAFARREADVVAQAKALAKTLKNFETPLWDSDLQHNVSEDFLRHYSRMHTHVTTLYAMTAFGGLSPPRRQELALVAHDKERVEALLGRINGPIRAAVRRYDNLAYGRKLGVLPLGQPIRMPRPPALPPVAKM